MQVLGRKMSHTAGMACPNMSRGPPTHLAAMTGPHTVQSGSLHPTLTGHLSRLVVVTTWFIIMPYWLRFNVAMMPPMLMHPPPFKMMANTIPPRECVLSTIKDWHALLSTFIVNHNLHLDPRWGINFSSSC